MADLARARQVAAGLAELRRQLEPDADDPDGELVICARCLQPFRRWKGDHITYCAGCGESAQLSANQQMSQRRGPVYEKAARKQLAFWTSEAKRLGLITDADAD